MGVVQLMEGRGEWNDWPLAAHNDHVPPLCL